MQGFLRQLADRNSDPRRRTWLFVPEDQLSQAMGPLSREDPRTIGIILIESYWKATRRPYHQQKLALVWTNLRHFALEQAARQVAVRYVFVDHPYHVALAPLAKELGSLQVMEPAERELRTDLASLVAAGELRVIPHEGWLTSRAQFLRAGGSAPPWRMDRFYRTVRMETGILIQQKRPIGGKFSFDVENRHTWKEVPPAPTPLRFPVDEITQEVGDLIAKHYPHHPGSLELNTIPATAQDSERLWDWVTRYCLPNFGPFEDAMSVQSRGIFHTRLSALINIHRLLPSRILKEAEALPIPVASREGFIRQILGWREFVNHVHRETDGFRQIPRHITTEAGVGRGSDHGARPSFLGATAPLPSAFWGTPSGLACLDHVVSDVWTEGYSHHITRLMVLANLATLLDVSPRELTDWFWVAYTDAYDWVVEPNVLAMGTYAVGDLMTTKPYVSGAAYIDKMSDYCECCPFDPRHTCPITHLYWAFLARHKTRLQENPRLRLPLQGLSRRTAAQRAHDTRVFQITSTTLQSGGRLTLDVLKRPAQD
jgi:deoxyribodipyrimidine photolyase-related protein